MDNFGDYLYFLIAAAWLVFSYLGNKKKKEAQRKKAAEQKSVSQEQYQPEAEEKKDFSTILDEILNEAKAKEEAEKKQRDVPAVPPTFKEVEQPKPYEFGHYETMEDDIVDEEAAYKDYATREYKAETSNDTETEQYAAFNENHPLKPVTDEHYRTTVAAGDDDDFDIEKAVIFSEILRRPKF